MVIRADFAFKAEKVYNPFMAPAVMTWCHQECFSSAIMENSDPGGSQNGDEIADLTEILNVNSVIT